MTTNESRAYRTSDNRRVTTSAEKSLVDRVRIEPNDDGPKRQFWGPVYLLLWDDGSVTWEVDRD